MPTGQRTQLPPPWPARRPPPAVQAVPASVPSLPSSASRDGPGPYLSGMGKKEGSYQALSLWPQLKTQGVLSSWVGPQGAGWGTLGLSHS